MPFLSYLVWRIQPSVFYGSNGRKVKKSEGILMCVIEIPDFCFLFFDIVIIFC